MKRWMAALCAVFCLFWQGALGEEQPWTQGEWAAVTAALASDAETPVPEARRLSPSGNGGRGTLDGDKAWMNVLLVSTDSPDIDQNFGRTDAVVIARVNLENGDTRLLSLPEDAMVALPELPEPIALRYVNCFGGPRLMARELNAALNLGLNRYCAVNMASFVSIIDALGGVSITLTEGEGAALGLEEGTRALTGEQALRYARLRRAGDGSFRVRALLQAVLSRAEQSGSLGEMLNLMDMLLPRVDTNLTADDLINLLFALSGQETPGRVETKALSFGAGGALDADAANRCRQFLLGEGE